ncbi:MAG TPA: TonB-dependent receptor [Steroidobacteraceae bacterium]|nr:TonB-dependent receptor [Steroidobacteraceae bacterium]
MRNRLSDPRVAIAVAAVSCTLLAPDLALAQESTALGEIIVTARKREENLQDVGVSISALSAEELANRFDVDLQTLANAAPNVVIDDIQQGPGSPAAISIRGVGTTDVEKNFDPAAGVVVDGVFVGVNSGAMLKALDLQSVEILRGPQGTLFGRNSIAGVINVTRGRPDYEGFGGAVRAGAGNNGDLQLDGYLNVPVGDNFAFRIGGAMRENDGWFRNATLDKDVGATEFSSVSPSFSFRPTDNFEIYYRFDKNWQDQDANTVLNLAQPDQAFCFFYNQCAQGLDVPQSGDRYVVLQDGDDPYQSYFDSELHLANIRWSLNDNDTIEYVFGDFSTDEKVYQDWDGTSLTLYHTDRPAVWEQQSHELRLTHTGERFTYTAGLYLWDSNYRIDLTSYIGFVDLLFGFPPGTVFTVEQTVIQNTDSKAAFFEGDYKFNDAWTLTLGGRYTEDKKDSGVIDPLMPELAIEGSPDNPFKESWSEFTPKAGLRYRISDAAMVYGLYSKGFRAGGFSGRPGTYEAASIAYDPETVDNYELGWKSEWLDGRLRLNSSVFFMKYDDKQEEQSVPTSQGTGQQTVVVNAASAEIMGLEVDFAAMFTDSFMLSGNLGLLEAEYKELVDPITQTDLSSLDLRRAPPVTATLSPSYTFPALGGEFTLQADWRYVGKQELTFLNSPQSHNPAHDVLDASINFRIRNTTISLWGLNLTDDDSWSQAYDVGTSVTFPGLWTYTATRPPMTYGVRLVHTF